jgi:hypothetical protein
MITSCPEILALLGQDLKPFYKPPVMLQGRILLNGWGTTVRDYRESQDSTSLLAASSGDALLDGW